MCVHIGKVRAGNSRRAALMKCEARRKKSEGPAGVVDRERERERGEQREARNALHMYIAARPAGAFFWASSRAGSLN